VRTAEELMTSRSRIETLDINTPPDDITARVTPSGRSRYPVVDGSLDRVVGLLHIKDFIRARQRGGSITLRELVLNQAQSGWLMGRVPPEGLVVVGGCRRDRLVAVNGLR